MLHLYHSCIHLIGSFCYSCSMRELCDWKSPKEQQLVFGHRVNYRWCQRFMCPKRKHSFPLHALSARPRAPPGRHSAHPGPLPVVASAVCDPLGASISQLSSNYGFGFSAGGLLFPYFLGVAVQLQVRFTLQAMSLIASSSFLSGWDTVSHSVSRGRQERTSRLLAFV